MTVASPVGAGANGCERPPVTMRLESADPPTGGADFEVTDGVGRRIPILTGRDEPGQTPKELARLERLAAKTKLAMYQIHLADFRIPRKSLKISTFPTVVPEAGQTFATLTIVPTKARGFKAGDVVTFDDFENIRYETFTTLATVTLGVSTADGDSKSGEGSGQVEVLSVDADEICVDVDFELTFNGELVAAAEGVIAVPVIKVAERIYFF